MSNKLLVMLLILATSVSMMSTDIYVPSMPHLTDFFGVSAEYVKLTISLNAAAYCIGTLIHGPLSERFGRKPVLIIAIASLAVFSMFCALSQSIEQLIIARIFQGFVAAAEGVIVLAIIRDVFEQRDQIRVLAIYEMAIALTPAIAPIIGGYIHVYLGWRANFYAIAAVSVITTILFQINLKESTSKDPDAIKIKEVWSDYLGLICNIHFMKYSLMLGSAFGFYFAFATAGPFILITNYGLPTEYFGYFQGGIVIAYIIGSFVTERIAKIIKPHIILRTVMFIVSTASLLLLAIVYADLETMYLLALCAAVIAFGTAPLFAVAPPLAMDATIKRTGSAAALLVSVEMGVGAIAAFCIAILHDGTSRPFALTVSCLFLSAALFYIFVPEEKESV